MRHRGFWVSAVAVLTAASTASAQRNAGFEYAVKVVCGRPDRAQAAPGTYFTAINLHNPAIDSVGVRFKVAATGPGTQAGRISPFSSLVLRSDEVAEIDCAQAMRMARVSGFLKGFVVLQAPSALDVVAVYTASGRTELVEAMDIERVPGRRGPAEGCPDLVVDSIATPTWDGANGRTVIHAVIRNVGTVAAQATFARVVDPTTLQPTGAPYNAVVGVPALIPGQSVTVTFYLPYWVYNPDVTLEVRADYKNDLAECEEGNNGRVFEGIG